MDEMKGEMMLQVELNNRMEETPRFSILLAMEITFKNASLLFLFSSEARQQGVWANLTCEGTSCRPTTISVSVSLASLVAVGTLWMMNCVHLLLTPGIPVCIFK